MDQQFATFDKLSVGVVTTFQPSDAQLLCHYLKNKIQNPSSTRKTFPQINIYGKDGMPPWEIWRIYQQCNYPHQEFIYFFARAEKINPEKRNKSRKIGTGTWHETEPVKSICVPGYEKGYGSLRKFRYQKEKKKKNDKDKQVIDIAEENHGAWLMDEFTIKQAPDLALYRLKVNGGRGGDKNKRKNIEEEDESLMMRSKQPLKKQKRALQNSCLSEQQQGSTSEQMPSSYFHQDQVAQVVPENNFADELEQILMSDNDQVAQVVPENDFADELEQILMTDNDQVAQVVPESNFADELEQILMSDDANIHVSSNAELFNELSPFVAPSIPNEQQPEPEQYSDYSSVPQQQLGPDESSSSQEEYQVPLPQPDQASSSHSNDKQLVTDEDITSMIDFGSFDVDTGLQFMNGHFTGEDEQSTLLPWNLDGD